MTRLLRIVALSTAAWLLAAGGALAASAPFAETLLEPLTSAYMRAVRPGDDADLHRDLFSAVLQRVHRSHAREVDLPSLVATALKTIEPLEPQSGTPAEVFTKAINTALISLDPHSRYLDPRAYGIERSSIRGSFGGLGLQVETAEGLVRVVAPMANTPAARAGLQAGDLIVSVDDRPVLGMPLTDAILLMRGEPGTPLTLTIRRAALDAEFTVSLVRETIQTEAVRWSMEGDVLVLRLARFTTSVAAMLEKAIMEATVRATPRAVVLDMRGNGGGLLREAVTTADIFLSQGDIVSIRERSAANQRTWKADAVERLAGVPMVVLIDGGSASATELVAAALQEHGRAIVMGQRSFGKGSVQTIVSLGANKGALRLTTSLYYGPSGRTVQGTGVGPDIELITASEAGARSKRREADRAQSLPGADEPLPPKARVEQSRCAAPRQDVDPALACALAFLGAGGIDTFVATLDSTN